MLALPADPAKLSRNAALAVCVLAGLLCLWLLARCLFVLLPHTADGAAAPVAAAPPAPARTAAQSIAAWHVFGDAQAIDAMRAQNAPHTALKLALRGTLALPDPADGIAIIADEANKEHSVGVGDTIGPAKLVEVHTDHVVLDHAGTLETLNLARAETGAVVPAPASPNARPPGGAASAPPGMAATPATAPANAAPDAVVANAPVLARANAADLIRQVQFEPVFEGGRLAGAHLSGSGAAAALMDQAGLLPTDTVTAVNGTPLSGVTSPQQLLDKLGNATSLQVTVQRGGKSSTLTLNLR